MNSVQTFSEFSYFSAFTTSPIILFLMYKWNDQHLLNAPGKLGVLHNLAHLLLTTTL